MVNLFLKARHWQLFLITIGIPIIVQGAIMGSMLSKLISNTEPNIFAIFDYMQVFLIAMLVSILSLFAWMWSIAIGLQKKIPEEIRMKTTLFKIFFFTPLLYMIFFVIFLMYSFLMIPVVGFDGYIFAFIIPMHLFCMFCMFYCLYFTSKTFKMAELQKEVIFENYIGEFFCIWFYPVGVWIIQPKINKMVREES